MVAVAAPVLCCLALGADQEGGGGGKGRAKNVPVTGVALASKDYEREKLRMLEDGYDQERIDEIGMRLPMHIGEQATLAAVVSPGNATNKKVIWASDDPTRATVENGVVTAVGHGWAQIVAITEDGHRTAECRVDVHRCPDFADTWMRDNKERVYGDRELVAQLHRRFETSRYRPYMGEGTAAINGRAILAFHGEPAETKGLIHAVRPHFDGHTEKPAASVAVAPADSAYFGAYAAKALNGFRIDPPVPKEAEALLRTAPCGADGGFEVAGLPAGRYAVYGSIPGEGWAELATVALRDGETKTVAASYVDPPKGRTARPEAKKQPGGRVPVTGVTLHNRSKEQAEEHGLFLKELGNDQVTVDETVRDMSRHEMLAITPGDQWPLTADVEPPDATNRDVFWVSTDQGVATVDDNGVVTAVGHGYAHILAITVDGHRADGQRVNVGEGVICSIE
jgi:hypothetical protein